MPNPKSRREKSPKRVLDLPDLEQAKALVLLVSFFLRELVHALMRQSQETSRIARAHL